MEWISVKDKLPKRSSQDSYLVTDGNSIGWCFFGCDDPGEEHDEFIGGDLCGSMYENITHWMKIILPNKKIGKARHIPDLSK